jgi:small subunit ribosomal protein S18
MAPRGRNSKNKTAGRRRAPERGPRRPAKCPNCTDGRSQPVDFKDVAALRRYMSDRAKIRSSRVTGLCPQCQRKVATAIKNAREMALLPYTNK